MREMRKTEQKLRKMQRTRPLKGGASVLFAADEELLRLREEAEEKDRQRGNRKRDNGCRRRRRRRRLGKEYEAVDIADKGRHQKE